MLLNACVNKLQLNKYLYFLSCQAVSYNYDKNNINFLYITTAMVRKAINKMSLGKAAGLSGIVPEMLKAAGPSDSRSH